MKNKIYTTTGLLFIGVQSQDTNQKKTQAGKKAKAAR
jgi:hypothetical protein